MADSAASALSAALPVDAESLRFSLASHGITTADNNSREEFDRTVSTKGEERRATSSPCREQGHSGLSNHPRDRDGLYLAELAGSCLGQRPALLKPFR